MLASRGHIAAHEGPPSPRPVGINRAPALPAVEVLQRAGREDLAAAPIGIGQSSPGCIFLLLEPSVADLMEMLAVEKERLGQVNHSPDLRQPQEQVQILGEVVFGTIAAEIQDDLTA